MMQGIRQGWRVGGGGGGGEHARFIDFEISSFSSCTVCPLLFYFTAYLRNSALEGRRVQGIITMSGGGGGGVHPFL